ncbi:hypothetical protein [Nocardioides piscis]|uniref:Uncharacterized protein n=1 Tax=Nocardioides piscis TaxID=2714938 RepID=A0A6G7YDE5_9ACTN|nr:hypothetical protein [Nocardioides piscis]QIK74842.1 hypothetical protein G7071_04755 [Nocardioides piscis]
MLTHDPAALDDLAHLVSASELLPGEDAALLPGPDRVTRCVDAVAFGQLADFLAGAPQ